MLRSVGKVYKPVADVDLGPESNEIYTHADVKAPRVAGLLVKIFVWFLESSITGPFLLYILKKGNLIHKFISYAEIPEPPLFTASHTVSDYTEQKINQINPDLSPIERVTEVVDSIPARVETNRNFRRWTIMDYSRAYTSGEITPLMVAEKFLAAVVDSSRQEPKMSFFINYDDRDIIRQATDSTLRYQKGTQISVLDGVLIAVKDEIDCMPYPSTGGTKWLHKARSVTKDANCVAQLRTCGAILVGKTNMHELGAGTSGINPNYGAARNPYDPNKVSGGSSSGSAAVVCAGLCPVALGVDGGGSVRMPAALCGVVGLKPTSKRVSSSGVLPLSWTVGMPGILAATVEDTLITYAAICDPLPLDQSKSLQPAINFPLLKSSRSLDGIKFAKSREWFNDCTDEIRSCCDDALKLLCKTYGWETVGLTVPEIEEMRLAHYITIGSECTSSLGPHLLKQDFGEIGYDVRVALSVYGSFDSNEYLNAQKVRNRQMHFHQEIFKMADVIVTPTTAVTAYPIASQALSSGDFDYINGAALVRYAIAGNFLGLPAVTIMVGCDKTGMPIGLQFIGRPWSEATLLHLAYATQDLYIESYRKPQVFYNLLKEEQGQ